MTELRMIPVHRSLHRRQLILGGERELVQLAALVTLIIAVPGMNIVSWASGAIVWFFALYILQRLAKADQHMSKIFSRYVKQQDFYAAHSTPWKSL